MLNNKKKPWKAFRLRMDENFNIYQTLFQKVLKNVKSKDNYHIRFIKDISERWREYFKELYNVKNDDKTTETLTGVVLDKANNNIRMRELKMAIMKLKIGKAPDHDGITPQMIKYLGKTGKQKWLELLNKITRTSEILSDWRIAIIMTLHKKQY